MPAQNLQKIEWTTLQEFLSKINANFAMIQNSPLFKGIPGESIQGDQGPEGRRGGKFLFVVYNPNFVNAFGLVGGSTNDIDVNFLTTHSDPINLTNLLLALETNDLIDGDVIVLESTTELVKVTTNQLNELVFTGTGIFLSQEIQALNQLQQLYNDTLALINSISIESNIVIDRFKSIALSFGYPSSANVVNPTITPDSVYYPFIEGISDYYNSGVDATEDTTLNNHLYYALSRDKYNGIHNYTFLTGNSEEFVNILDATQNIEDISTGLEHLPTRDFLPAQIILQNNHREGLLIGNKTTMNKFSRLFKNNSNELVITSLYEHEPSIDNGNIDSTNYKLFNYGLMILSHSKMMWNKEFENYGTFRLIGDFVQNNYKDLNNQQLTFFDSPFLRTRTATADQDDTHIEFGFVENNTNLPYQNSLTEIFSDDIRLADHNQNNGFGSIFLYTDSNGKIRKDIFKESVLGSNVGDYPDDVATGGGSYNFSDFWTSLDRNGSDKQVVTSDYLSALSRIIVGIEPGTTMSQMPDMNIRNFGHVWLMDDFAPNNESSVYKNAREIWNQSNNKFGYERISSLELNKNFIVGRSTLDGNDHKYDQIFRIIQGAPNNLTHNDKNNPLNPGYNFMPVYPIQNNNIGLITLGNLDKSLIPSPWSSILGSVSLVNQQNSNTFIFAKWAEMYWPGIKPRTVLSVESNTNAQYGRVQTDMIYSDFAFGNLTQSPQYISLYSGVASNFPSNNTEFDMINFVRDNIDNEDISFELSFAVATTQVGLTYQETVSRINKINKFSGDSEETPFRKKLLTGSHWRILWGAFDKFRKYIKDNFYKKDEIDNMVAPLGSIIAWTPLQEISNFQPMIPSVNIPKGWVPCFGGYALINDNGTQKQIKVPDLTQKFVLGEYVEKYYVDGTTMRVVCKGGLLNNSKYGGRNAAVLEEKYIPPHIHQHTHDAAGIIRARCVISKTTNFSNPPAAGNFKNVFQKDLYFNSPQYSDILTPNSSETPGVASGATGVTENWNVIKPSNDTTFQGRYPREWGLNTRNSGLGYIGTAPKQVDENTPSFSSLGNSVDGVYGAPNCGNKWTGVFGGKLDTNLQVRVQEPIDLVSRHLKLIYIYRVGPNLIDYTADSRTGTPYTTQKTSNFANIAVI